jgi:hypothetical protein
MALSLWSSRPRLTGVPDSAMLYDASLLQSFRQFLEEHRDEITALQILFNRGTGGEDGALPLLKVYSRLPNKI